MATAAAGVAAMGKRCVENIYVIDIVSVQEGLRLCVLKGARWSGRPRDVIPWSANGAPP